MFFVKIVFSVVACLTVTNYIFVGGQDEEPPPAEDQQQPPPPPPPPAQEAPPHRDVAPLDDAGEQPEENLEEKTELPPEHHTFVALIEIVFTDGRKRTCTGTIIHENVVITAAHCFFDHNHSVDAELTASFVIIGTQKMYETGYENYLPIERVITHPNFKGWTADIALVYTFASMTDDKPGNVIPIIGESALTPVDSNVTILSWGHCKDDAQTNTRSPVYKNAEEKRICSTEEENHESCEPPSPPPLRQGSSSQEPSSEDVFPQRSQTENSPAHDSLTTTSKVGTTTKASQRLSQSVRDSHKRSHERVTNKASRYSPREFRGKKTKFQPNPLVPVKKEEAWQKQRHEKDKGLNVSVSNGNLDYEYALLGVQVRSRVKNDEFMDEEGEKTYKKGIFEITRKPNSLQKRHKNWRRNAKDSQLTVEIFGFVNVQTCKKMVDRALPAIYAINTNEVVCYAAEEHYISDDDSGAPAIRQGHLVAVTLGGVECEGDHVAIGIKMNCLCSWIAENLPDKSLNLQCCKDCCKGGEGPKPHPSPQSARNKHLYK